MDDNIKQKNNAWPIILIVLILLLGAYFLIFNKKNDTGEPLGDKGPEDYEFCFADIKISEAGRGLEDEYTLRFTLDGDKAKGEIRFLPSQKDGKVGKFEGIVSTLNQATMSRTIDGWWDAEAEGTKVREEVQIKYGDGSASVGSGGMREESEGVYVYQNKESIQHNLSFPQIDCAVLDERANVEAYLKENISTLAPNEPVLGGKWFTLYSSINTTNDTGYVVYEDGHVMEEEAFSYATDENGEVISLTIGMILSGSLCEEAGGTYDATYGECTGISGSLCANMGGDWNECASACRHDPDAEVCTMQCVAVCELPTK